ncbi:hypothetical protein Pla52o_05100 [Novipirellula galeiformis]|uniref:F0F1-ATPase subunit n=1 Tax=Novipirellula galeiformis TaxID=2528004 RepID=A0A5C6CT00_9BACT|nr:AtpZ/AtpI family protein [Novipirellula galeiformis]TWU26657.1 hypothetical protein Pla52o_05100 [Novipirellula galeiformis]
MPNPVDDLPEPSVPEPNDRATATDDGSSGPVEKHHASVTNAGEGVAWIGFVGLGMELAGVTLLFAGIGYWIDSWRGHVVMYATALSTMVGFGFAMARFIVKVSRKRSR